MGPKVSVIIPVKKINDYLRQETVPAILKQTHRDFEIIVLPDKPTKEKLPKTRIIPTWPKTGPADKRDLGAQKATGEILAFLDDDSYPDKNWLKKAIKVFQESEVITAVCGPALTSPHDNLRQKASGYVWSTRLGSGGAGTYRCAAQPRRTVEDFPSVNFLVRREDFSTVGGFDSHFWPGEDTKLCLDLVYQLKKKIIYDPSVLVYHHRREVFSPHLKQISRYAVHRGHFARILPQTSLQIGYLMPTLFVLGLFGGPILIFVFKLSGINRLAAVLFPFYLLSLIVYLFLLLATAIQVCLKEKNLKLAFLVAFTIVVTHLVYGVLFVRGFFSTKLKQ